MKLLKTVSIATIVSAALISQFAYSAIALDRTRVIYNEGDKSVSMTLSNENKNNPYLAQAWIEDQNDVKVNSPFLVTPPVHRIEADSKSQIKIQGLPAALQLPNDRESVYYLNVREIPPRSDKPNVLQIALQTKIKIFYRPKALKQKERMESIPQQNEIKILNQGGNYIVKNPSPFFISLTKVKQGDLEVANFEPMMIAPFGQESLGKAIGNLGTSPTLVYLNDFGGPVDLNFTCHANQCSVVPKK
ncbi:fimbria/pilus periplasmic chaperone [Providencia sneebia]|uniref:Pili chaperone protein n=1 Tax=Providencia sneebia DSM 19967 TaxID=1141660 RepID=K8VY09_9GAMM|nr:fimbria/pilus periplasmic chaperone [Providencia sneebia]EKT53133.1 pili chaperone protein [Providencia sneebia DSM 19967]